MLSPVLLMASLVTPTWCVAMYMGLLAGEARREALQQAPLQEPCSQLVPVLTMRARSTPPVPSRTASGTSRCHSDLLLP